MRMIQNFISNSTPFKQRLFQSITWGVGCISLALFSSPTYAATALEQLNAFSSATQSLQGNFSQQTSNSQAKVQKQLQGEFAFQRPGRFRWIIQKPAEQWIIADGNYLTIYDKDLNQAVIKKMDQALSATPVELLFGSVDFSKLFNIQERTDQGGVVWLQATPKKADAGFSRLDIAFKNNLPIALELRDSFGQLTSIQLTKLSANAKLPAHYFEFNAPPGTEILRTQDGPEQANRAIIPPSSASNSK